MTCPDFGEFASSLELGCVFWGEGVLLCLCLSPNHKTTTENVAEELR